MRCKLVFLSLILLILLCGTTLASLTEIHNAWHTYKESFTYGTDAYSFIVNPSDDQKLLFKANDFSWIIDLGECIRDDIYEYCFENMTYDRTEAIITDDGKFVPAVHIIVRKEDEENPDVTFKFEYIHNADRDETLKITASNGAKDWINPLDLRIQIPAGVTITNLGQFTKLDKTLHVGTSLSAGASKTWMFDFTSVRVGDHTFNYTYSFRDAKSEKSGEGTNTFNIQGPYKLTATLSPESIEIFNKVKYEIIIENTQANIPLEIQSFEIDIPEENIQYVNLDNLKRLYPGKFVSTQTQIAAGKDKKFIFYATPSNKEDYNFTTKIVLVSKGLIYEESINKTLQATAGGIIDKVYFDKTEVLSGSTATLHYALGNENKEIKYFDYTITIQCEFFNDTYVIPEILSNAPLNSVYKKTITLPITQEDKSYQVVVHSRYKTGTGQEFYFNRTLDISVSGAGEILRIYRDVKPSGTINPGDELTIEVFVENIKDERFQKINVLEEFSRGAQVTFGQAYALFDMVGKEKKKAYTYKVKLPEKYFEDTFNISTTAVISTRGYKKVDSISLAVNATIPEQEIVSEEDTDITDQIEVSSDQERSSKEPGFFVKLVTSIEEFFNNLFS